MKVEPIPNLKVDITTGPHGNNTVLTIDGVIQKRARKFILEAACDGATQLTVEYVGVEATVDGIVETTAFKSETRTYLALAPEAEDE